MQQHKIVSPQQWTEARQKLLAKEKELTRLRDQLTEERRALPWVRVDKAYVFDGPAGRETLADLFAGHSQLIVYHFMFAPDWEAGCKSCSFWADNFERNVIHLAHRDVTMIAVSRAPLAKLEAFRKRMGWTFKWVSSAENDFNFDYQVSFPPDGRGGKTYNYAPKRFDAPELPGISVFYKDGEGDVFHTYSAYARGIDLMNAAYQYLDVVPKGRDEVGASNDNKMTWLRHRDRYE